MFKKLLSNKKGFTLMELIIVMAVIGILAMLAIPQINKFKERAYKTRIINDSRVIKDLAASEIATKGTFPADEEKSIKLKREIEGAAKARRLFINGEREDNEDYEAQQNFYHELDEEFINNKLKGKVYGKFIIDIKYNVYYIADDSIMIELDADFKVPGKDSDLENEEGNDNNNDKPEGSDSGSGNDEVYEATDEDFKFITDSDYGYSVVRNGKYADGYYKYIGQEKVVKIPKEIEGNTIVSTYKMFFKNRIVSKVVYEGNDLKDTNYMFEDVILSDLDLSEFNTKGVQSMKYMFSGASISGELKFINNNGTTKFVVDEVIYMNYMFSFTNLHKDKILDLSLFKTSNLENINSMFKSATLGKVDLSSFDVSNVNNSNSDDAFKVNKSQKQPVIFIASNKNYNSLKNIFDNNTNSSNHKAQLENKDVK